MFSQNNKVLHIVLWYSKYSILNAALQTETTIYTDAVTKRIAYDLESFFQ